MLNHVCFVLFFLCEINRTLLVTRLIDRAWYLMRICELNSSFPGSTRWTHNIIMHGVLRVLMLIPGISPAYSSSNEHLMIVML